MNAQQKYSNTANLELVPSLATEIASERGRNQAWLKRIFGFFLPIEPDLALETWEAIESKRRRSTSVCRRAPDLAESRRMGHCL